MYQVSQSKTDVPQACAWGASVLFYSRLSRSLIAAAHCRLAPGRCHVPITTGVPATTNNRCLVFCSFAIGAAILLAIGWNAITSGIRAFLRFFHIPSLQSGRHGRVSDMACSMPPSSKWMGRASRLEFAQRKFLASGDATSARTAQWRTPRIVRFPLLSFLR